MSLRSRGPEAHGPSVRKKYLNGFSLQREAHLGIEVGLARPVLSGVFRAFCPPPQGKPFTAVFFFSRPLFPPGPLRGFLAPARGDRFFKFKSGKIGMSHFSFQVKTVRSRVHLPAYL